MRKLILTVLLFASCIDDTKKTGLHKSSQSILESRQNGVFIAELKAINPSIHLSGLFTDTVSEAWVETAWTYETKNGKIVIQKDSFDNLNIRFKNPIDAKLILDSFFILHGKNRFTYNGVFSSEFRSRQDTIIFYKKIESYDIPCDTLFVTN